MPRRAFYTVFPVPMYGSAYAYGQPCPRRHMTSLAGMGTAYLDGRKNPRRRNLRRGSASARYSAERSLISTVYFLESLGVAARTRVRSALAILPCLPMTLPISESESRTVTLIAELLHNVLDKIQHNDFLLIWVHEFSRPKARRGGVPFATVRLYRTVRLKRSPLLFAKNLSAKSFLRVLRYENSVI